MQNALIVCLVGLCSTSSAFMPFNKPELLSRQNITLDRFRSGLLSLRSSMPTSLEPVGMPASKLSGKWKKIEEVGQDQAMVQVSYISPHCRQVAAFFLNIQFYAAWVEHHI